jgi:hypothetical protein
MIMSTKSLHTDNKLEDYFLELLVSKHAIDREIKDLITIIDTSVVHDDYKKSLKHILFGEKNLYIENWGTLHENLRDIMQIHDTRGKDVESFGIVLQMMTGIVEAVFDVHDDSFHGFIVSEIREEIEHNLIILMKRSLDMLEVALAEELKEAHNLTSKNAKNDTEFEVIQATLQKLPKMIFEEVRALIDPLKIQIDVWSRESHDRLKKNKL